MNFQELYKEFQPRIRRYLCHLVGPDEAEDVAQDVFAKVSQALPEFRGDSTVSTWIYRSRRIARSTDCAASRHDAFRKCPSMVRTGRRTGRRTQSTACSERKCAIALIST